MILLFQNGLSFYAIPHIRISHFLTSTKITTFMVYRMKQSSLGYFPYTLWDRAREWLHSLLRGINRTWNDLTYKFRHQVFSPRRKQLNWNMRSELSGRPSRSIFMKHGKCSKIRLESTVTMVKEGLASLVLLHRIELVTPTTIDSAANGFIALKATNKVTELFETVVICGPSKELRIQ